MGSCVVWPMPEAHCFQGFWRVLIQADPRDPAVPNGEYEGRPGGHLDAPSSSLVSNVRHKYIVVGRRVELAFDQDLLKVRVVVRVEPHDLLEAAVDIGK